MATLPTAAERLADVLARLETERAANHTRISGAPVSEATRSNLRGVVERSHAHAARLCPQIFAAFGNSGNSEARH